MKKALLLLVILFIAIYCTKQIPIVPELSELPFPLEGDNELMDKSLKGALTRSWRFFQRGNLEDATYTNRKSLTKSPKIPALWVMEAYINLAYGNADKAKSNFTTATEIRPDYPTALNGIAFMAFLDKDYPSAYTLYKKLAALYPDFPSVKIKSDIATLKVVDYYKLKAEKALQENKHKDAIENYKRAIVISPTIWELHYNLGVIFLQLNDYENALVYLQLANNLNPGSKKIKETLANSLFKTGKFSQALEYYKDLVFSDPQNNLWTLKMNECQRLIDFSKLPSEFRDAEKNDKISRGVFAAYLVYKIPALSRILPKTHAILTDISTHWAKDFIITAVNLNIMEEFSNHTFEPYNYIKKSDLAYALDKLLQLSHELNPDINLGEPGLTVTLSDVAAEYSKYNSIRKVVSLGFMDSNEKSQFKPESYVTGDELTKTINKIALLFPDKNTD